MDTSGKPSSPILPLVVAGFAGATLAIACERPDARAQVDQDHPAERVASQPAVPAARPVPPAAAATAVGPVNDNIISGRIKAALLTDPAMSDADISVNTDHGVVSLVGSVKSHEQMGIASAHAQRQDGVMRVDSHVSLAPQ